MGFPQPASARLHHGLLRRRDDRTPDQLERFGKGLKGINVWYGHQYTTTLVCDFAMPEGAENPAPIDMRGWCIFEKMLSSMRKDGDCCLTLSQLPPGGGALNWVGVMRACQANRLAPLTPDEFEKLMTDGMASGKITFTVRRLLSNRRPVSWC